MRCDAAQADHLLVQRRDQRELAGLLERGERLADASSRRSRGRAVVISSTSRARVGRLGVADLAASVSAWRRLRRRRASGSRLRPWRGLGIVRGSRCTFGLRLRGSTATSSDAPQSFAPSCADNPRRPRASRSGPSRPSRTPALPRCVGQPDLAEAALARACGRASGPA